MQGDLEIGSLAGDKSLYLAPEEALDGSGRSESVGSMKKEKERERERRKRVRGGGGGRRWKLGKRERAERSFREEGKLRQVWGLKGS